MINHYPQLLLNVMPRTYQSACDLITPSYFCVAVMYVICVFVFRPQYRYVRDDESYIGTKYRKVVYMEYSDMSFKILKPRHGDQAHLGIMGPMIKAEVGDVIKVVFKNMASRPYSLHAHGVFYDKSNEGSVYNDENYFKGDDKIEPGVVFTYKWKVPHRSGPGPKDTNCVPWPYYSSVDPSKDVSSGLVGAMIICRSNTLDLSGRRRDVNREFALLFSKFDETESWYYNFNRRRGAFQRRGDENDDFVESNQKYSINGFIYGNVPGLGMEEKDITAWYVLAMGNCDDLYTVHFQGHTFAHRSLLQSPVRQDTMEIFAGTSESIEMLTTNPGTWLLHSHVNKQFEAGMSALYQVHAQSKFKYDSNTSRSPRITMKSVTFKHRSKLNHRVVGKYISIVYIRYSKLS